MGGYSAIMVTKKSVTKNATFPRTEGLSRAAASLHMDTSTLVAHINCQCIYLSFMVTFVTLCKSTLLSKIVTLNKPFFSLSTFLFASLARPRAGGCGCGRVLFMLNWSLFYLTDGFTPRQITELTNILLP